jgi:hypothetical protein
MKTTMIERFFIASVGLLSSSAIHGQQKAPPVRLWDVGPLVRATSVPEVTFGTRRANFTSPRVSSQTSSTFAATRRVIFSGDRVVALVLTETRNAEDSQIPLPSCELFSIEIKSGQIKESRGLDDCGSPKIFATGDDHVIVALANRVVRLTTDLKDDETLDYGASGHKFNKVESISPDGTTLGDATRPGFELIDTKTLAPKQLTTAPSIDTSVNSRGFITDNIHWINDFPKNLSFVTYVDENGQHLLYHGKCGGRPQFISDELIFEPGCKQALIMNTKGALVQSLELKESFSFAGTSEKVKRLALQLATFDGSHDLKREHFLILSFDNFQKIADIEPDERAQEQSWTAMSSDGSMFVVGSAQKLSLWRVSEAQ